jgi:hypothetical protein
MSFTLGLNIITTLSFVFNERKILVAIFSATVCVYAQIYSANFFSDSSEAYFKGVALYILFELLRLSIGKRKKMFSRALEMVLLVMMLVISHVNMIMCFNFISVILFIFNHIIYFFILSPRLNMKIIDFLRFRDSSNNFKYISVSIMSPTLLMAYSWVTDLITIKEALYLSMAMLVLENSLSTKNFSIWSNRRERKHLAGLSIISLISFLYIHDVQVFILGYSYVVIAICNYLVNVYEENIKIIRRGD